MNKPKQINIYNLNYFFNFLPINISGIKPNMIIQFGYRSPDGVHDKNPLVYVLEVQSNRVYGLNLHYNFKLLQPLIEQKEKEVSKYNIPEPSLKDKVADAKGIGSVLSKIPIEVLEYYSISQQSSNILRNYLYPRISSLKKLSYKP